jgi:hypothetical protein
VKAATPKSGERTTASGTSKAAASGEEMKALIRDTILEVLRDVAPPTAAADRREPVASSTSGEKIGSNGR